MTDVEYAGQAVAVVVAESAAIAADARELVRVVYTPRPVVATVDDALGAGRLLVRRTGSHGAVDAVFAAAPLTFTETFTHGRCAAVPMEPRGVVADWDGDTLTSGHRPRRPRFCARAGGRAGTHAVAGPRIVPDVGGGFGLKVHVFPEDLAVAAAARRLRRPVKWVEERAENLGATIHARKGGSRWRWRGSLRARAGPARPRHVRRRRVPHLSAHGGAGAAGDASILPGPYRIEAYAWEALAVRTHKPPARGVPRRGHDDGRVRHGARHGPGGRARGARSGRGAPPNFIPADAYPWASPAGFVYDSGDYPRALDQALALADYPALRREQATARAAGRLVGVGLACYTEYTGMGAEGFRRRGLTDLPGVEAATLTMDADGSVRCATSFPSQGQGHATTIAQVVADRLGIALECVRVVPPTLRSLPPAAGPSPVAARSRSAARWWWPPSGSASGCACWPRGSWRRRAPTSSSPTAARMSVAFPSAASRSPSWRGWRPFRRAADCPPDSSPASRPPCPSIPPGPTFAGAVHVALVEIDRETGRVSVRRYVVVEDCGRVVNPMIVEGQIHGAVAQGLGEALLESIVYDATGRSSPAR